jgi:hypothetical protein
LLQKERLATGKQVKKDSASLKPKPRNDIFQNEFEDEKPDTSAKARQQKNNIASARPAPLAPPPANQPVLNRSKLYDYRLKFDADYVQAGVTNDILIDRFQPYAGGSGPIELNNGNDINFTLRLAASDIMEDMKFSGGISFGTNLTDKAVYFSFQNYKKMLDWGLTYYRSNQTNFSGLFTGYYAGYDNMLITNLYQANLTLPINEVKSIRATFGIRSDKAVLRAYDGYPDLTTLGVKDTTRLTAVTHVEYVHDNSINPTQNIWNGLRWKVYTDLDFPLNSTTNTATGSTLETKPIFNVGYDARYYYKIYRNFIWAVRGAGDFSWGESKIIYYLGGADGWVGPKFNTANTVLSTQNYAFQSLELNMRGYDQNLAHGNNAMVFNSEFRLPVFTTLFNKPINNAFIRNFQVIQFFDFGTAWEGGLSNIGRPTNIYSDPSVTPVVVRVRAGGIGPFAGGYGFGVRSTLLGYFLKLDAGWPMQGFFSGSPILYFALGFDF